MVWTRGSGTTGVIPPRLLDVLAMRVEGRDHGAPAVLTKTGSVSLAELMDSAKALANALCEQRAGGQRVLLGMGPCCELIVGVIACWLTGGSFVPISLDDPKRRIDAIVDLCGSSLVLTRASTDSPGQPVGRCGGIRIGRLTEMEPGRVRVPPDEAYVIFTSGSSGVPKGVSVGHDALSFYLQEAAARYVSEPRVLTAGFHLVPTFDAAITSYLLPLLVGGVCVPLGGRVPTMELAKFMTSTAGPMLIKTTPAQLRILSKLLNPREVAHLEGAVVVGGEPLFYEDCYWLRGAKKLIIHNEYGPTEATVGCIIYSFRADESQSTGPVPIGEPHGAVEVEVRGSTRAADGVAGELLLSGPVIANGYVGRVGGGFHRRRGAVSYHTGDLVRVKDGLLYFMGREDDQKKVGAYRVELGEINAVLRLVDGARSVTSGLKDGMLWAAVEHDDPRVINTVWELAGRNLPRYMVPRRLLVMPRFPVSAQGKVDREAIADAVWKAWGD